MCSNINVRHIWYLPDPCIGLPLIQAREVAQPVYSSVLCSHWRSFASIYTHGRSVIAQTNHRPLVAIQKKPIAKALMRLQKMLVRLPDYGYHIVRVPGKDMHLADALSRAYLPNKDACWNAVRDCELRHCGQPDSRGAAGAAKCCGCRPADESIDEHCPE